MISTKPWFEAWQFAAEAQQVIALRMMRFLQGDASSGPEAALMVTERRWPRPPRRMAPRQQR